MKKHTKYGGEICFQMHVGTGTYNGTEFTLGVTVTPVGNVLGMPIFSFRDEAMTQIVFEMENLLPLALEAAGIVDGAVAGRG